MKYYKDEFGQVIQVQDKTWERWKRIEPSLIEKEVFLKPEKEFDKLNDYEDSKDSGTDSTGKAATSAANKSKPRSVGENKPKQGRPKKVQTSTGKTTSKK